MTDEQKSGLTRAWGPAAFVTALVVVLAVMLLIGILVN